MRRIRSSTDESQTNRGRRSVYSGIIVTVKGNMEALIENYQGIIAYDSHTLRLKAKQQQLEISGSHLVIAYYTREELKVSGCISKIEIHGGGT